MKDMPHIIHSCTSWSSSGLEHYVLQLAAHQRQTGLSIELFCREGSWLHTQAIKREIPVWLIPGRLRKGPIAWMHTRKEWKKKIREHHKITLHMHAGGEPWFHLPWLNKIHQSILHYHIWINHSKKDWLHRFLFKRISELWTSTETSQKHLQELLPVPESKFFVLPYGRDVQKIHALDVALLRHKYRQQWNIPKDATLGICVSRIERIKGIEELFDAFLNIAPQCPNAYFWMIGGISPQNPEADLLYEKMQKKHSQLPPSLKKRFLWLGHQSHVEEYMAASDFYVLPSHEECLSLALLDAAIIGLPLIGTDSGGTPSVIIHERTGLLVLPKNSMDLAEALKRFYEDPRLREVCSIHAKKLSSRYDQQLVFKKIEERYGS